MGQLIKQIQMKICPALYLENTLKLRIWYKKNHMLSLLIMILAQNCILSNSNIDLVFYK